MHAVVRLLAVDLRGKPGHARVGVVHQRRNANLVGGLVETAARDRARPVEQVQLDERRAAVFLRLAVEREDVGVVRKQLVHGARMADLVLGNRRKRDILFEHRCDSRPLGVAPAEDQLVVSQRQEQIRALVHERFATFP